MNFHGAYVSRDNHRCGSFSHRTVGRHPSRVVFGLADCGSSSCALHDTREGAMVDHVRMPKSSRWEWLIERIGWCFLGAFLVAGWLGILGSSGSLNHSVAETGRLRASHGLERLDQIKHAILESSGGISIVPR